MFESRRHTQQAGPKYFRLGAVCLLLLTAGCSSFSREWRAAGKTASRDPRTGRWEGTWTSTPSGHHGRLRCVLTPNGPGQYQAHFCANYGRALRYSYTVTLPGTNQSETFVFDTTAHLPKWAGGLYHYSGTIQGTNFFSTYRCSYDRGTFQMGKQGNSK